MSGEPEVFPVKESQPASSPALTTPPIEPVSRARKGARRIVGVQFRRAAGMVYDFDAGDHLLAHDTRVVVQSERGELLGWTVGEPEDREPVVVEGQLRRILRPAGSGDLEKETSHHTREREVLRFAAERVRAEGLEMKMVAADWAHSGEKVVVYFSSEERVDFRSLVRDLAQRFRVRVEMRQVGPRDEVKILGALGPCGRETCCTSWLRNFSPVSIRMAKDQGLAINPQKVTGVCGRLLCCLAFEQEAYRDLRRKLPKLGKIVSTARGPAKVVDVMVLRQKVRVLVEGGEFLELGVDEVGAPGSPPAARPSTEVSTPAAPPPREQQRVLARAVERARQEEVPVLPPPPETPAKKDGQRRRGRGRPEGERRADGQTSPSPRPKAPAPARKAQPPRAEKSAASKPPQKPAAPPKKDEAPKAEGDGAKRRFKRRSRGKGGSPGGGAPGGGGQPS